jgi:hypothetical protein
MRKTLGRTALLALCVLVANSVLAGHITRRGVVKPTLQTIYGFAAPLTNSTVSGIVEVRGYVLDAREVSRVTLLVDGAPVHDADINQPYPEVRRKYPRFQGEEFPYEPGFVTSFLASNYTDGAHTVSLQVTYSNSDVETLPGITVTVDNTINWAPIGALDSPGGQNIYVSSVYPVTGWVLDADGVRTTTATDGKVLADIEVMVDDMVVGQALYPLPRPDVANAHPDVAGSLNSGFQMNLDTTRFTNGMHTVSVRAWDALGLSRVIGSSSAWFDNNYTTLGPFGKIDWPMSNGYMFSTGCRFQIPPSGVEYDPTHFQNWVSGWAIDQNSDARFRGIKYVELLIDGVLLKRTSTDCAFQQIFDTEVNCFGKARPDVFYLYPQFTADAKNSGFFFAIDGDVLIADTAVGGYGIHRGLHYLSIRVGTQDPVRPATVIDQIPVVVTCNDLGDSPSFGDLEQPLAMQDVQGSILVKGWALDLNSLKQLNFYVDGVLDGSLAVPNPKINMSRPDVYIKYPWLPYFSARNSGFEYTLDTTKYVDGVHQLVIESVDYGDWRNYWVQRPLVFNNPN